MSGPASGLEGLRPDDGDLSEMIVAAQTVLASGLPHVAITAPEAVSILLELQKLRRNTVIAKSEMSAFTSSLEGLREELAEAIVNNEADLFIGKWPATVASQSAVEALLLRIATLAEQLEGSAPRPRWRPISEAPKDGSSMLLAKIVGHPDHPSALWWATRGHWSEKWKNWNDGLEPSGLADPTHFLPLSDILMPESRS